MNVNDHIPIAARLLMRIGPHIPRRNDALYIRLLYLLMTGKKLSLVNPSSFNEKIQWLKLYWRQDGLWRFVDKLTAKEEAKRRCRWINTIPTLQCARFPETIDIEALGENFILKPTRGGGGNVFICRSSHDIDRRKLSEWTREALKADIYGRYAEWPYRDAPPGIIAEPILAEPEEMRDYKFFCFDGEPLFLKIDSNRFSEHRANYFTADFKPLPFSEGSYPPLATDSPLLVAPPNLDRMLECARLLSKDFPFVRIDFYNIEGEIFFGEFSFFPRSGLGRWNPVDADIQIGELLNLPNSGK